MDHKKIVLLENSPSSCRCRIFGFIRMLIRAYRGVLNVRALCLGFHKVHAALRRSFNGCRETYTKALNPKPCATIEDKKSARFQFRPLCGHLTR